MTGTKAQVEGLKRKEKAKSQALEATRHSSAVEPTSDSRAAHYVAQEKTQLRQRDKLAKANRTLRHS